MSSGHMCRFLRAQQEGADKYKDHESVPSAGASEQNVSQSGGGGGRWDVKHILA